MKGEAMDHAKNTYSNEGPSDWAAFLVAQATVAGLLLGLYYFVGFEVAILVGLAILILQVAQP